MTLVVDASLVVAAFIDNAEKGEWARAVLRSDQVAAPQLMQAEATNILRRSVLFGTIPAPIASLAVSDMLALPVELISFEPHARRVWELLENVTAYDAWYVAVAETLDSPLATLDGRLIRSPGPRCQFLTFPG